MPVFTAVERFTVHFGRPPEPCPQGSSLGLSLPLLAGASTELLFPPVRPVGSIGAFEIFEAGDWLLGFATKQVSPGKIERLTRDLYDDLLTATREWHLARVWNYVPQINTHIGGLENYRAFCLGRALAFEVEFGGEQFSRLSAASAVGTGDDQMAVIFAATRRVPTHFENPSQVSAYRYPAEHGPRAPSFARATVTADGRHAFISGTAAIKGHVTIAPGDTLRQVDCTLDNLALVSQTAGLGPELGAGGKWSRYFKVYLRRAADLEAVKAKLEATFLRPDDVVTWLQADICRAELMVEIEATLVAK